MPRSATVSALLAVLALSGCLGEEERRSRIAGDTATVYASLPRAGVSAPAARAVAAGQRLALEDARGRAGGLRVKLIEVGAADRDGAAWSPGRVSANAERAADDPRAIAYLGELDFGASAVSVPITNDAGLLQVSPTDTLTSLTQTPIGRPRAGPERYYPTGSRSFARLVPNDDLLAETLLELARQGGASRMALVFDADIYSRELAGQLVALGRRDGPLPVRFEEYLGDVEEIPDVVRRLAEGRPDLVVYAGIAGPGTGRMLAQIEARLPGVPVYATAGLLARDPAARIPAAPASVRALGVMPPRRELTTEGRRLLARVARVAGQGRPGPRLCTATEPCASCSTPSAPEAPTASAYAGPAHASASSNPPSAITSCAAPETSTHSGSRCGHCARGASNSCALWSHEGRLTPR